MNNEETHLDKRIGFIIPKRSSLILDNAEVSYKNLRDDYEELKAVIEAIEHCGAYQMELWYDDKWMVRVKHPTLDDPKYLEESEASGKWDSAVLRLSAKIDAVEKAEWDALFGEIKND